MPCDPNQQAAPTTASYSKAVTSSLFGQERGLVRKVEPSLMGKSDANESSLSNCRVQLTLSTKKDGMILEKKLDDFRNQNPLLVSKGLSKSFSTACFVSFSERLACSVGMRQSIPRDSSKIEIPPSASG